MMRLKRGSSGGLLAACEDVNALGFPLWPKQRKLLLAAEQGAQTQSLNAQQTAYWNAIGAGALNAQPYGAGGAATGSVPNPNQSIYSQYVQPNLPAPPTNPVLSDEERRRLAALSTGAKFV